ncbi:MAG: hypothetical protein FJ224_13180 [Lentisphaerae bacterium]|nr:hypothetical protein [Lentisphaerota bacterium]
MKANDRGREDGVAPVCSRSNEAAEFCLGEMTDERAGAYSAHMRECAECREAAGSYRRIAGELRTVAGPECRPGFAARVMAGIERERRRPVMLRMPFAVRIGACAAGLAIGVGLALFALRRDTAGPRPAGAVACGIPADRVRCVSDWLCAAQRDDGSWPAGSVVYDVGVTAAAMLSLLTADDTAEAAGKRATVTRAADYLVSRQDADGLFGPSFAGGTYNHGLASLAMVEAAAACTNAVWRASAMRGIAYIAGSQNAAGGWAYIGSGSGVNVSATIWPLLALLRARETGMADNARQIYRGLSVLHGSVGGQGLLSYDDPETGSVASAALTAAGLVCMLKGRFDPSDPVLREMKVSVRKNAVGGAGSSDFYLGYFAVEALALAGDDKSDSARRSLRDGLLARVQPDGPDRGRWAGKGPWDLPGGPVCATAFAAMSLR